jgi:hypothetical protein
MTSVHLRIADIVFEISSQDKRIVELIGNGFQGFLSDQKKPHVAIGVIPQGDFSKNPYECGKPHSISVNELGDYITASGSSFSGWLRLKEKKAEVSVAPSVAAFYLFLRFVTILMLSQEGGCVIHASSIAHNGRGYIFSGRPDSGKSTMAALSLDKKVLCDDFSIIKKAANVFKVFPSPFWGKVKPGGSNNQGSYPVEGIYFLNHSDENFVRPFKSRQKKMVLLHQNMLMFPTLRHHCNRVFEIEHEVIDQIPLFKLYFVPKSSVWGCINGK